jgi:hypothetical protein
MEVVNQEWFQDNYKIFIYIYFRHTYESNKDNYYSANHAEIFWSSSLAFRISEKSKSNGSSHIMGRPILLWS